MSDPASNNAEETVVEVVLTEQQAVLLDHLRREGAFGSEDGEIVRRVFQEFARQEGS